jgi:hypothetical protein
MNHQDLIIAQNLYNLFESLPQETQHLFLQRLFQEKPTELAEFTFYLDCQEAKTEADFLSDEEAKIFIEHLPK